MEGPDLEVLNLTHKGKLRFGKRGSLFSRKGVGQRTRQHKTKVTFEKLNNIEAVLYSSKITICFPGCFFLTTQWRTPSFWITV